MNDIFEIVNEMKIWLSKCRGLSNALTNATSYSTGGFSFDEHTFGATYEKANYDDFDIVDILFYEQYSEESFQGLQDYGIDSQLINRVAELSNCPSFINSNKDIHSLIVKWRSVGHFDDPSLYANKIGKIINDFCNYIEEVISELIELNNVIDATISEQGYDIEPPPVLHDENLTSKESYIRFMKLVKESIGSLIIQLKLSVNHKPEIENFLSLLEKIIDHAHKVEKVNDNKIFDLNEIKNFLTSRLYNINEANPKHIKRHINEIITYLDEKKHQWGKYSKERDVKHKLYRYAIGQFVILKSNEEQYKVIEVKRVSGKQMYTISNMKGKNKQVTLSEIRKA
jgi:hypothetical protein